MIKATELRIGNLVLFGINTELQSVFKIDYTIKDGHLINGQVPEDHLHPIPLSPELLEKCGFMKDGGDSMAWIRQGIILIKPTDYDDGRLIVVGLSYWVEDEQHCCYVHHLHQLQNLYFALTGSEIEIKL